MERAAVEQPKYDDLNEEERMEHYALSQEQVKSVSNADGAPAEEWASLPKGAKNEFVHPKNFVTVTDEAVRKSIEGSRVFAETIVASKFDAAERQVFSEVIRKFNKLYWEMGVQTWLTTKWRGVGVLKPPTDMWIYQELIWTIQPDLIIETGTYRGGSALFMRDVLDMCGLSKTKIITIDIDRSGLAKAFTDRLGGVNDLIFINASSVADQTMQHVRRYVDSSQKVMVILDSDHSYEHVTKELELYAPLVSVGSALVIEDTSNCPEVLRAVQDWYFDRRTEFRHDVMCEKLMLSFNRDGYYERIA